MHGRRTCLAKLASVAASLGLAPSLMSCGALIHPERVGQPRTGRLDTSIVLLDGLGLLLFLVPGLIAFIVDFSTGAIYLPPEHYGASEPGDMQSNGLIKLSGDPRRMSREEIEAAVSRASGAKVRLEKGRYSAMPLESLDGYSSAVALLERRKPGTVDEVVFRCQSP